MNGMRWFRHPLAIAAFALGGLGLLALLPEGTNPSGTLVLVRLSLALLAIVALAFAAIPFLKRVPGATRSERRRLQCSEQLSLGARQRVALISVDERELLVSLNAEGCRLLVDLGASITTEAGNERSESLSAIGAALGHRNAS